MRPVNVVSSEEGEDGGDDPDDAAHRVEAAVYFVEGEITGERPPFTEAGQPLTVASYDLIIQASLCLCLSARDPGLTVTVPRPTVISHLQSSLLTS